MAPRTIALLAVAAVLAAGCSGDDDASSTTASDESTADTTTAPTTTSPATTAPTTAAPSTTPATTAPPTTVDAFGDWCTVAADLQAQLDAGDEVDYTDPAAVETFLDELVPALEDAVDLAPDEIADQVRITAEVTSEFRDALAETDFDLLTADLSVIEERGDERDAAGDEVEEFNAEFCGIPVDDESDEESSDGTGEESDDFSFGEGSLRDQFIGQLVSSGFTLPEAACIFDELDFSDVDALGDPAVLGPVFETCGISAERIEEIGSTGAPDVASPDLLESSLTAAGLDEDQIACVVDELEGRPPTELTEEAIVEVILDCGVGIDELADVDPSALGGVEDAFVDEFVAMGFDEDDARCVYDEVFVGNIDGIDSTDMFAAFEACGIDPAGP
jgi:hypothetical protein